jgi:hypothetical protein
MLTLYDRALRKDDGKFVSQNNAIQKVEKSKSEKAGRIRGVSQDAAVTSHDMIIPSPEAGVLSPSYESLGESKT